MKIQRLKAALFISVCLRLVCSGLAQSGPAPTSMTLQVVKAGENGQAVQLLTSVTADGNSVTAGQVIFSINGSDYAPIQVVGAGPNSSVGVGTSSLVLSLLSDTYNVAARYTGTAAWAPSSTVTSAVTVSGFADANLALVNSGSSYQFTLNTRENLGGTGGSVSLLNLVPAGTLASDPIVTGSISQVKTRSALQLPFSPSAFAIGDLLGGGQPDVVVADPSTNTIEMFEVSAVDGSEPFATVTVGSQPSAMLIQDLNGDGFPDVAVVNTGDNTVSIVFQDPAHPGSFKPAISITVGVMPVALAVGDFNHDGFPDIAVANFSDNTISILLNQSTDVGQFSIATTIATPGGPSSIAVGHFFGTDSDDLAVSAFYDNSISIFANKSGQVNLLPEKQVFRVGTGPTNVVVGDFNGDGLADLAVCNSVDGTVSLLPAIAAHPGQFPVQDVYEGFVQPSKVAILTNLDGVSPTDLAVTDSVTGILTVLYNDGSGRLATRKIETAGGSLSGVASVYRFTSGAYMLATLDPSLHAVHYDGLEWSASGSFSPVSATPSAEMSLQAQYVPLSFTTPAVLSNIVAVSSTSRSPQTIDFAQITPGAYGSGPLVLEASSTSNLPVTFSIISGSASIIGTQLVSALPGDIVVQADQAGNDQFLAANPVQRTVSVALAPLSITPQAASRVLGASNPAFTGSLIGLIGSDTIRVDYSSSADTQTPVGVYNSLPLGISAHVRSSVVASRYQVKSSVGTLTICPLVGTADPAFQCGTASGVTTMPTLPPVTSVPPPTTPIVKGLPITPIQTGGNGVYTTIVGTSGTGPGQVGNTDTGSSGGVSGGVGTPPTTAPSPVKVPGTSGTTTSTGPELPHGLYPHGGPINAPPVQVSRNGNGGRLPRPTAPVRDPSAGTGGSPSTPVVMPVPIIAPSIPHPMLPLIGITFGGGDHVKSPPALQNISGILLLQDGRAPEIPGLMAITVTLTCSADRGHSRNLVLSVDDSAIATLEVKTGEEFKTYLPVSRFQGGHLMAHFAGSNLCPSTRSEAIVAETPTSEFLELFQKVVSGEIDTLNANEPAESEDGKQNFVGHSSLDQ